MAASANNSDAAIRANFSGSDGVISLLEMFFIGHHLIDGEGLSQIDFRELAMIDKANIRLIFGKPFKTEMFGSHRSPNGWQLY
ncbi:hypothetical protein PCANC_23316 [Puccinia coronata f. sp. avenae]|uniref:Uncharacterized protein n=1 Tax=Puccinia coronata f. sp. avenae TaxID=200324 RepID=A0A2N5VHG1_9BASI|nr:hypothetical protein PCANC_23316 [Puccinia coronata f. sp. avenae]PLW49412.1 hypothetical protein PCASD_01964 [Puccinia coronata f. sp. avenae]